jgi:hypothetical protein
LSTPLYGSESGYGAVFLHRTIVKLQKLIMCHMAVMALLKMTMSMTLALEININFILDASSFCIHLQACDARVHDERKKALKVIIIISVILIFMVNRM